MRKHSPVALTIERVLRRKGSKWSRRQLKMVMSYVAANQAAQRQRVAEAVLGRYGKEEVPSVLATYEFLRLPALLRRFDPKKAGEAATRSLLALVRRDLAYYAMQRLDEICGFRRREVPPPTVHNEDGEEVEAESPATTLDPEEQTQREEGLRAFRAEIEGALSSLPKTERAIIRWRYLLDRPARELSRRLGVRVERIQAVEQRARRFLRGPLASLERAVGRLPEAHSPIPYVRHARPTPQGQIP